MRQVDHQEQCGLMADAWGNAAFARPEPFGPVRAAAARHDEGWRGWEAAPRAAAGAPVNFTGMDRPDARRDLPGRHRRRPGARPARGAAGELGGLYGRGLYEYTPPADRDPLARVFIAEQEAVQGELMRRARRRAGARRVGVGRLSPGAHLGRPQPVPDLARSARGPAGRRCATCRGGRGSGGSTST